MHIQRTNIHCSPTLVQQTDIKPDYRVSKGLERNAFRIALETTKNYGGNLLFFYGNSVIFSRYFSMNKSQR